MTVSVVSLLVPEEVMFSLFVPEELTFSLISLLAESAPEAAAVGPRGDQAVVGGDGIALNPLCPVGFDFHLLVTSDEFFKPPSRLASAVEPGENFTVDPIKKEERKLIA